MKHINVRPVRDKEKDLVAVYMDAVLHHSRYMSETEFQNISNAGLALRERQMVAAFYLLPEENSGSFGGNEMYRRLCRHVRTAFALNNVTYKICTAQLNGWVVAFVSGMSTETDEFASQLSEFRETCRELLEKWKNDNKTAAGVIISQRIKDTHGISLSYNAVCDEYDFRRYFNAWDDCVSCLDDSWGDTNRYEYWKSSSDSASEFCECVLQGRRDDAHTIVRGIFDELMSFRPYSLQRLFWDIQSFFDVVLFIFTEKGALPPTALSRIEVSRTIFEAVNSEQLNEALLGIVDSFFDEQTKQRKSFVALRMGMVKDYVDKNTSNAALSVSGISEHFDVSQPLLSMQFKKHYGSSLTEYIQKKRLDAAQQLLANTDLSIEDICARTGFGSVVTLHRCFKKNYGISPGQFRANQRVPE